jgi:hypothetical protein
MKTLISLANQDFLVSPETAARVTAALQPGRYTLTDVPDPLPLPMLGGQQSKPSVFDRARQRQQDQLTDREQKVAQRWAKHMEQRQKPPSKRT